MLHNLQQRFQSLDFASLLWALPVVYFLHEMEEWNAGPWEQAHFPALPDIPLVGSRLWFLGSGILLFLITWLATRFKHPKITAYITVPFIVFTLLNGCQHILWSLFVRDLSPGVIFGGFAGVPLGSLLLALALRKRLIHPVYVLPFGAYAVFIIAKTILLRDTMPLVADAIPLITWLDTMIKH